MIGEERVIASPQRQGRDWKMVGYKVKVLKELNLPVGNQPLFRVEYEEGKQGTAWQNQLISMEEFRQKYGEG